MDLSLTGSSLNCVFPSLGLPFAGLPFAGSSLAGSSLTVSSLRWVFRSLGLPFTGASRRWVFPSLGLPFAGSFLQWIFPSLGLPFAEFFIDLAFSSKHSPVCGVDPWTPLQTAQIAGQEQCVVFYKMVYRKGDGETRTSICSTTTAQEKNPMPLIPMKIFVSAHRENC